MQNSQPKRAMLREKARGRKHKRGKAKVKLLPEGILMQNQHEKHSPNVWHERGSKNRALCGAARGLDRQK